MPHALTITRNWLFADNEIQSPVGRPKRPSSTAITPRGCYGLFQASYVLVDGADENRYTEKKTRREKRMTTKAERCGDLMKFGSY